MLLTKVFIEHLQDSLNRIVFWVVHQTVAHHFVLDPAMHLTVNFVRMIGVEMPHCLNSLVLLLWHPDNSIKVLLNKTVDLIPHVDLIPLA